MKLIIEIIIVVIFTLQISFAFPQEESDQVCLYGENCEFCPCDKNRCLMCSPYGYCVCFDGMHYNGYNSSCVLSNNLEISGDTCPSSPRNYGERCTTSIPNCKFCTDELECIDGMCGCKRGSFYKKSEEKCYVYPGEACQKDSTCMENSHCIEGNCTCKENFIRDHHKCLLGYNATCRNYNKCHRGVHLECVHFKTVVSERKKKNRKLSSWRCKCIAEGELFVWSKNQKRCIALHGTRCDTKKYAYKDICIINSSCNQNTSKCECHDGFAPVNNRCLQKCNSNKNNSKIKKYNYTEDCGEFKVCKNNVCSCVLNKMVYDDCGECRVPLGHSCGSESNNYTCDSGLICSSTCGKCTFPESSLCTSSGGYLTILLSTALVSFMILVIS